MLRPKQYEVLGLVVRLLVLQEFDPGHAPAERVDIGHQQVGLDLDSLAFEGDQSRDRRRHGGGRRRRRLSRWGWNCARDALGLLGLLGGGRHGSRLGTLLLLPLGPQEQEGKAENEEENESLGIHGFHVL